MQEILNCICHSEMVGTLKFAVFLHLQEFKEGIFMHLKIRVVNLQFTFAFTGFDCIYISKRKLPQDHSMLTPSLTDFP